ncbi:DUF3558 domain-containing protein [Corynebacterium hylobatis]|uniref:DUF3558 domain-containing protein n=1 Tax=Corynebacterium hylobatis TaxID=1859290 RepID=A0A3S0HGJ3_9CORY|nr:DUF3558 domain-containing protein [Corynebacterium hylobatis]RSZ62401.1 DUF3558 domain-containing protein [Corynebacterium hylobatis]
MPARRLLPLILTALILTACSPDDTPIDAPSSPPASPTTVEPVAQPIELGDFDPEGDFEVFNPCTEIPAEVRAAAGLGEPVGEPFSDAGKSESCSFNSLDPSQQGFFALAGDKVPKSRIEERGMLLAPTTEATVPGIYLHHMGSGVPDECSAALHTTRGRFVVHYMETLTTQSRDDLCSLAVQKLEDIHQLLGEDNGDSH